jgi:CubicO group peptidase (beta-lactamase class C family)
MKKKLFTGNQKQRFGSFWIHILFFFIAFHSSPFVRFPSISVYAGQHTPFEAAVANFEAKLAGDVAKDGVGGVIAGVVVENRLVWARGFGWSDVMKSIPIDVHTIGRTGSISKSFTAVLMMQLVEAGFFGLDDPVADYFPEINSLSDSLKKRKPITFRHLASHTSGLIREPKLEGAASGPIAYWEEKILTSIPNTSFLASPGEKYSYSNIGFGILGLAVSRAAKKPFMQLMNDYIFRPLDMKRSTFVLTDEMWDHLSTGYQVKKDSTIDSEQPAIEHSGRGYKVPNGGIYSTVPDLTKFIAAMTGASSVHILTRESREEMQKFQTSMSDSTGYGLGFFIRVSADGIKVVGHSGSVAGYNAYLGFNPNSRIGVILLRNYIPGSTHLRRSGEALLIELVRAGK